MFTKRFKVDGAGLFVYPAMGFGKHQRHHSRYESSLMRFHLTKQGRYNRRSKSVKDKDIFGSIYQLPSFLFHSTPFESHSSSLRFLFFFLSLIFLPYSVFFFSLLMSRFDPLLLRKTSFVTNVLPFHTNISMLIVGFPLY